MRPCRFIAVFIVLSIAASGAPGASARSEATPAAPTDPRVERAFSSSSLTRVVVSLKLDAVTRDAIARGDATAIERAIAAPSSRVRSSLSPEARVLRVYRAVPALLVEGTPQAIDALRTHPDVAHVALDTPIHALLDESVPLMNADDVHATLGVTGAGVTVAVLDTGVDTDHPALVGDVSAEACFIITGGCPLASGVAGGCGPNDDTSSAFAEDGNGHGTHVAGIVTSAGHDGGQDRGIAPDAFVKAFKVLDDCGNGDIANLIDAIDAILTSHPDVRMINMSVGDGTANSPGSCDSLIPAMTTAVITARAAGVITFASSGNTGAKTGVTYPACIDGVVSVGAVYDASLPPVTYTACTDETPAPDEVTCFSQSSSALDLLAPGANLQSTYVGGGFVGLSGTSMSSPAAAAVAALVLSDEPSLTADAVEVRLKLTGVPITDPANGVTTCRVDALKGVLYSGPLCLAPSTDTDADGCTDAEENTAVPQQGGARDPLDFWDFFDVTNDRVVDLQDTLDVLSFFGQQAPPATPADLRDRYVPDIQQPWRTAEANNGVDLVDALANLRSFGASCVAPP